MNPEFGRLLTAMVTPFTRDDEIDYKRTVELVDMLLQTGTEGFVVCGTTGESPTLTHEEEFELFRVIKRTVGKKAAVIAGTGSNSTRTTIKSTRMAEEIGVDAAMIVVPYYNKPSQEGLYQHFTAVAESTSLPLVLYNIPGRTSRNLEVETLVRLAKHDNIVAIKEAAGSLEQVKAIRAAIPEPFKIYSGDDAMTLAMMEQGGHGVISVAAHIAGKDMSNMIQAYAKGDIEKAQTINKKLQPLFDVLFITTNPTPVKAALTMIWKDVGIPRLPLIEATTEETQQLKNVLSDLGYM